MVQAYRFSVLHYKYSIHLLRYKATLIMILKNWLKKTTVLPIFFSVVLFPLSSVASSLDDLLESDSINDLEDIALPESNLSLKAMDNDSMKDVTGKALFDIRQRTGSDGMQFLKFLLNAKIEINANIEKLKLGNQLDFDYLSITGDDGFDKRTPDKSAVITRPFLELALDNFNIEQDKKLVGLRFGAESMDGRLSVGTNDDTSGINRFRGYISTTPIEARGRTNQRTYAYQGLQYTASRVTIGSGWTALSLPNVPINVDVCMGVRRFRCSSAGQPVPSTTININPSDGYGLVLDSSVRNQYNTVNGLKIAPGNITVNGLRDVYSRLEIGNTSFQGSQIANGGYLIASADPLRNLRARANGTGQVVFALPVGANAFINRVNLNAIPIHFTESLKYLHDIPLQGDGGFLSVQSQKVCWPGSAAANCSQRGYWFEITTPVDLGPLQLSNINIPDQALRDVVTALRPALSSASHIAANIGQLQNIQVNLSTPVNLGLNTFTQPISQSNLDIINQNPATNCYGGIDCF